MHCTGTRAEEKTFAVFVPIAAETEATRKGDEFPEQLALSETEAPEVGVEILSPSAMATVGDVPRAMTIGNVETGVG